MEVEGLKDVSFGLAPLTRNEAEKMVSSTWAGKKLDGFRSISPADKEAVTEILVRLSYLAESLPDLMELEINPLRVMTPGSGSIAIDCRAKK